LLSVRFLERVESYDRIKIGAMLQQTLPEFQADLIMAAFKSWMVHQASFLV
jgi:hypothetical protein